MAGNGHPLTPFGFDSSLIESDHARDKKESVSGPFQFPPWTLIVSWTGPIASAQMIESVSPTAGSSGTWVTITGSGFGKRQGSSTVTFNGTPAAGTSWIDSEVIVAVPEGATSGPVAVTAHDEPSNPLPFTVFPQVSSLSPAAGTAGSAFTIHGSHFGATGGAGSVQFNGLPAPIIRWSESQIVAAVPDGAASGPVVVTVHEAVSNRNQVFTVTSESTFSLTSIALTPEHPTRTVGQTVSLTPVGIFKNGFAQPLSLATVTAGIAHTCAVFSEGTVSC